MTTTESNVGASADLVRVGPASLVPLESRDPNLGDEITWALMETYGAPSRRQERRGEDRNRAHILDVGYAGYSDEPGSVAAYNINPETGSLAIATSTGSDTVVEAAVRGFGYAMWARQTQHAKTIGKALGLIQDGVDGLPKAIRGAQRYREEQEPASATLSGIQLFDNKLLVNGRHPVFIYDLQTADCAWPNRGMDASSLTGSNVHILNRGQHIVIMSAGRASNEGLGTLKVRAALQSILANPPEEQPLDAQTIADELNSLLATDDSQGALLVGIIDLEPWKDRRPFWKKLGDYTLRLPSTALYGLAAFAVDKKRRQFYETRTTAGRLGRAAAITGDLALNAGFLAFAYGMARSTMGAAEEASGLLAAGPGTMAGGQSGVPVDTPPVEQSPHITIEAYSDSRVATGHDPLSNGHASTVSNWSHDALQHYGEQEHLPQAAIDQLTHDQATVAEVNDAFYNDDANPNNGKVADDSKHWLNAGDRYSQVDQGEAAHQAVLETKHTLGLDVPPPPIPEPMEAATPAPSHVVAAAPVAAENELQSLMQFLAANWAEIAAASGGTGLLAIGAAAQHRRTLRKKRGELVESVNKGTLITSHNEARRVENGKLLASARLPRRNLNSALTAPVSMLDDEEAVAELAGTSSESVLALSASPAFDAQWARFNEAT